MKKIPAANDTLVAAPPLEALVPTTTIPATVRTRVRIPLRFADGYAVTAEAVTFRGLADGAEHLALILGEISTAATPLVRLHS
jgi:GTP cyclohydrolase II